MTNEIASPAALKVLDMISASVALAAFIKFLPPLAALASLIYACMRMFDWVEERLAKRKNKKPE